MIWRILRMLMAVVLVMGAEGNCGPQGTKEGGEGKAGRAQCETHVQGRVQGEPLSPYYERQGQQEFIIGRTVSTCDKAPTTHTVEVHLQRKVKGVWSNEQMVFAGGGFDVCNQIPQPGTPAVCERKHPACTSGMWRVWFTVTYAGDGGALGPKSGTFVPNDGELPIMTINCPGS